MNLFQLELDPRPGNACTSVAFTSERVWGLRAATAIGWGWGGKCPAPALEGATLGRMDTPLWMMASDSSPHPFSPVAQSLQPVPGHQKQGSQVSCWLSSLDPAEQRLGHCLVCSPALLTTSLGSVPACCGHGWHFLTQPLSSFGVFWARAQCLEAPGPSRRKRRHARPLASPQQPPGSSRVSRRKGGGAGGGRDRWAWGCSGAASLPSPSGLGHSPHFPSPRWCSGAGSNLGIHGNHRGGWKFRGRRRLNAFLQILESGRGRGTFPSLMSKSLKHHFPLTGSHST